MKTNPNLKIGNFITLQAKPGQENNLAEFLMTGAKTVAETETQTLSWYAVRMDKSTFAIVDFFTNQAGQDAHVTGKFATTLKAKADEMIVGGWENGVLKNFKVWEVISGAI